MLGHSVVEDQVRRCTVPMCRAARASTRKHYCRGMGVLPLGRLLYIHAIAPTITGGKFYNGRRCASPVMCVICVPRPCLVEQARLGHKTEVWPQYVVPHARCFDVRHLRLFSRTSDFLGAARGTKGGGGGVGSVLRRADG